MEMPNPKRCKLEEEDLDCGVLVEEEEDDDDDDDASNYMVTVVCNGMEGAYIPELHMVICKCDSCGSKKQTPSEWVKHTGCRAKNWKYMKVKPTMLPPEKWLQNSTQYCGICHQIWHPSDSGNWVCCDGCNVWVHAECDKISSEVLKDLEHIDYYCPDCKVKSKCESLGLVKCQQKASSMLTVQKLNPEEVTVVCMGMEGTYIPKLHRVICKCGSCGSKKQRPIGWVKHTGCRSKNWKYRMKVKPTMLPLEKWLKNSTQYCGICHQKWHHSDSGNWVCCDGCNVWVHAECDEISMEAMKDLEHIDYYCPDCKGKSKCGSLSLVKRLQKASSMLTVQKSLNPEEVTVVCKGMEGTYIPKLHMVICKCGSCGSKKQTPTGWVKHTRCKAKKWKYSVKVKPTMLPLEKWIEEYNKYGFNPPELNKQQLLGFLQEKYEPANMKWTTERCAVCRGIEVWEDNKIIICNRCQIAVHQECYGAKDLQDFTSWVCRACETPDVIRECCLCPVRGGALKPTDVDTLWVHVSCAWFRCEVGFLNHEKMEPAVGILDIPPTTFLKRCVICKQIHGSCIKCYSCSTHFHTMCASREGYSMEVMSLEKNGIPITKKLIYCRCHRTPDPDAVVVVRNFIKSQPN